MQWPFHLAYVWWEADTEQILPPHRTHPLGAGLLLWCVRRGPSVLNLDRGKNPYGTANMIA